MKTYAKILLLMPITIALCAGCVSQEQTGFQADAPTFLRPGAKTLNGAKLEDIVVTSKTPIVARPMDTQLIRKVADKSQPAVVSIFVKSQTRYLISCSSPAWPARQGSFFT